MPQAYEHELPNNNANTGAKGILLYVLPTPLFIKLVISLLAVNLLNILFTVAALFIFYSAAHLTRTTLLRLHEHHRNRPHNIKDYRLLAAIFTSAGVLILMLMSRRPLVMTLVMLFSAFIGYYLLYGLPTKKHQPTRQYDNMPSATREAIKEAYADLETIETFTKQLNKPEDKAIVTALNKALNQSYVIMDLLIKAPEDAGRARRFLNVYINRIKEILQQYITLSQHGKADKLRERLTTTLNDVERAFREKKSQLLDDDIFKLDIQLEVLDEQIKQE
ncbi:MAG: 5-bromo-4-chloroindolyl phosphate hydrolysis family protein [Ostreibacterium sp.]